MNQTDRILNGFLWAAGLAVSMLLLAGCKTNNAPMLALGCRYYVGYQGNFAPESDGNFLGGSATSGIVDNVAGALPSEGAAAGESDVATGGARTRAVLAISDNETDYARTTDATLSAIMDSVRSAQQAAAKQSTASGQTTDQGSDVSVPVNIDTSAVPGL